MDCGALIKAVSSRVISGLLDMAVWALKVSNSLLKGIFVKESDFENSQKLGNQALLILLDSDTLSVESLHGALSVQGRIYFRYMTALICSIGGRKSWGSCNNLSERFPLVGNLTIRDFGLHIGKKIEFSRKN